MKRLIQQKVEDPLSDALLAGQFEDGDNLIVDIEDGEVVIRRNEKEASVSPEAVAAA